MVCKRKRICKSFHEDLKIKSYIRKELKQAAVSKVVVERPAQKAIISIHTARPGVVIGKKGSDIEKINKKYLKLPGNST